MKFQCSKTMVFLAGAVSGAGLTALFTVTGNSEPPSGAPGLTPPAREASAAAGGNPAVNPSKPPAAGAGAPRPLPVNKETAAPGEFDIAWDAAARKDVLAALQEAVDRRLLMTANDPLKMILRHVTFENAAALRDFIQTRVPADYEIADLRLANALGNHLGGVNPAEGVKEVAQFATKELQESALRGLLASQEAKADPREIFETVLSADVSAEFAAAARNVLAEWYAYQNIQTEKAPAAMAYLFEKLAADPAALLTGIERMSLRFPALTAQRVATDETLNPAQDGALAEAAFSGWALEDANAAAEYLKANPHLHLKDAAVAGLVQVLNGQDPEAAEQWTNVIGDEHWRNAARSKTRSRR